MRSGDRWRYWLAQAGLRSGQAGSGPGSLEELAKKANYYGFLAADELDLAYNICPEEPDVAAAEVERIAANEGLQRALELREVGLHDWAIGEWTMAARRLPTADLQAVAALARQEGWDDRVIFALGNRGKDRLKAFRIGRTVVRRKSNPNQQQPRP